MAARRAADGRARAAGPALLIAGCLLIAANLRPPITAVGPLVGEIRAGTGLSAAVAGLLTTLPLLAFAAVSSLGPPIAIRLGIERTLHGALVLIASGVLLRSVGPIGALFAGTAVLGAGIALGNVLLPGLIKQDFPARVGLMTSLYSTSMVAMAGVAAGVAIPLSDDAGLGWRGSLACWALLAGAAFAVWSPVARRPRHIRGSDRARPPRLRRSALAWQVAIYMGLQSLVFFAAIAWLPTLLEDDGLSAGAAGWLLGLMQVASLAATMAVPVLAARRPTQRRLVLASAGLCLLGLVGLLAAGSSLAAVWVLSLGAGTGAFFSLALTLFVLRAPDVRHAGALSGMAQSVGYAIAATGPIGLGYLHDVTGSWTAPLAVLVLVTLGALATGLGAARDRWVP